jgi:hypothetical protein
MNLGIHDRRRRPCVPRATMRELLMMRDICSIIVA